MKNYIQPGNLLPLIAPYARSSGQAAKIGSIVAVATEDVAISATATFALEGVFDVDKVSAEAWTPGLRIYWDDTAKLFTLVVGSNTLAGVAVETVGTSTATGKVRLNAAF